MNVFTSHKKNNSSRTIMVQSARQTDTGDTSFNSMEIWEKELYDKLRFTVPVIDAAINKIVRLTGGFRLISSDESMQKLLDCFSGEIPVGPSGNSLHSFIDGFLDSLLTYGTAVGEILVDREAMQVSGLYNGDAYAVEAVPGVSPGCPNFSVRLSNGKKQLLPYPQLILYSALNPAPGKTTGVSILRGLPSLSAVLMKIYKCIGQNYERAGNIRYAVTYKPGSDPSEKMFSKERAMQIADEWSAGMNAARHGEMRDFIAVGDVDIKVIGAENQLINTEIPVKQILEQLIAKLSIPPFLLGLNWSTTERMSSQQADILTSELEYYRRILTPIIKKIAVTFLTLSGSDADVLVEWDNINLQDEVSLAEARLKNAQALEIENKINNEISGG